MNRRGSALLIVLGVLAFLVISAVSFSAFMRRARLPSSYLRRDTATRQLAKAALAEAIDAIDRGIGNAVHPGFPGSSGMNLWSNRVYFANGVLLSSASTAPVLTLEGLAYLPPPLVNDVRYLQRLTPTAHWRPFGFDVGRYAYLAVDVSDYLDVNRLLANRPRSSASNGRFRMTHLFEKGAGTRLHREPTGDEATWDQWMESEFRSTDQDLNVTFDQSGKVPFVSLADFNLALGAHGKIGNMRSPFYEYIKNNGSGSFYPYDSGAELEAYSDMTLVTDGLFPMPTKRTLANGSVVDLYDLSNAENQPFDMTKLKAEKAHLGEAALSTGLQNKRRNNWYNSLSGVGCAVLMDYLDVDRIPISLAIPTTERVPMICGIRLNLDESSAGGFALDYDSGTETVVSTGENATRTVEQTVKWQVNAEKFERAVMASYVQSLVTYPFLHQDESDGTNPARRFQLDGCLSLFFSTVDAAGNGIGLRTSNKDILHLTSDQLPATGITADGVMNIQIPGIWIETKTLDEGVAETEEDAVYASQVNGAAQAFAAAGMRLGPPFKAVGNEFLTITYQWTQKQNANTSDWEPKLETMRQNMGTYGGSITAAKCFLTPLTTGGEVDADFVGGNGTSQLAQKLMNASWAPKIQLNAAVWLRVRDMVENKTVDLVPACYKDDQIQNGSPSLDPRLQSLGAMTGGTLYPLMCFKTGVELEFSPAALEKYAQGPGDSLATQTKAILVPDPRYNYAPEHWFQYNTANPALTATDWTQNNGITASNGSGGMRRADDIFMATSDAGYLQSLYELAFLPRLSNLNGPGANPITGNLGSPNGGNNLNSLTFPASISSVANRDLMWVNYDLFDAGELNRLRDYDTEWSLARFSSEGSGQKVNPYTDSSNVLMSVFANTPLDWRRASTNIWPQDSIQLLPDKYRNMTAKAFNEEYAWNDYASGEGGRLVWSDLAAMAQTYLRAVHFSGKTWEDAWRDLAWEMTGEPDQIFGLTLSPDSDCLWSCDRRFFYGYWHDCFAVRQQLFLVFVRAEQLMLGGDSAEQLPPQKGARAVAVVWRDPEGHANNAGYPHRTRVLFYHQFE